MQRTPAALWRWALVAGIAATLAGPAVAQTLTFGVIPHSIPIVVHPRVPAASLQAVSAALLGMAVDPDGAKVLAAGAALRKLDPPPGIVAAESGDYDKARRFLRTSVLRGEAP